MSQESGERNEEKILAKNGEAPRLTPSYCRPSAPACAGHVAAGKLDRTRRALFYALFFSVPIIFAPPLYSAFEPLKKYVLQMITGLLIMTTGLRIAKTKVLPYGWHAGVLCYAVYLVVLLAAALLGDYPSVGLASFRDELVVFVLCLVLLAHREEARPAFWTGTLAGSFLSALYAIVQHRGLDFVSWEGDWMFTRSTSTLGNPDYLSGYLAAVVALHSIAFLRARSPLAKTIFFLSTLSCYLGMLFTYARGGWLCFGLLAIFYAAVFARRKPYALAGLAVGFLVLFGLFSRERVVFDQREQTPVSRILSAADSRYPSLQIRRALWEGTMRRVRLRPLSGYGPGMYTFDFQHFRNRDLNELAGRERAPEHPHNEYLALAHAGGLPLLSAFLWLSLSVLFRLGGTSWEAWAMRGLWLAVMVQYVFYYPTTPMVLLFAALIALGGPARTGAWRIPTSFRLLPKLLPAAAALAALLLFFQGITWIVADHAFNRAASVAEQLSGRVVAVDEAELSAGPKEAQARAEKVIQARRFLETAYLLRPDEMLYGHQLAVFYLQLARQAPEENEKAKKLFFEQAEAVARRLHALYPKTAASHALLGIIYAERGAWQAEYRSEALKHFREAVVLEPAHPIWRRHLAVVYLQLEEWDRATYHLWKAAESDHSYAEPLSLLGLMAYRRGDTEKAIFFQREALKIDPRLRDAYARLALLLMEKKAYNDGLGVVVTALAVFPNDQTFLLLQQAFLAKLTRLEQDKG